MKKQNQGEPRTLMIGLTPPLEGGSETHIYEISSRIENVTVLTQKNSKCKKKIGLPILKNPGLIKNLSFFISATLYSFFLLFSKKKYDVIHIHENLLYILAPILKIRYKIIITVHGITGFKFYENKFLWFFFKNFLRSADKVISVSLADKELLEKEIFSSKIEYIPNGVDIDIYKKIKLSKNEKIISFVGRIHKQKGLEYLLEAFQEISKRFPEYKLVIFGKNEGSYYKTLSSRYKNKSLIWKGFISDRKTLFSGISSSEMLVFPSMWEALPWPALLEGLASGRPVIASDLPGMRRVFKNNENIVLAKPGSSVDLAEKIAQLINQKSNAKKIGLNGKKISQEYSWSSISKRIHKIYKLFS
ncbi:hypothetical protein COU60_00885 [Candidatus Pacearchaeota archaeon CG10_big_fil_rev_8_21_14_0_10_34_76]|nr:MAG: hypothetical protein COU60_00885 [Candidatus Pacearchaeota archaeon CG10_big_fil_rev_8_21_14_0_10_34_76]